MTEDEPEVESNAKPDPLRRFTRRLRSLLNTFDDQMQALRDIIDTTIPYASALDEPGSRIAAMMPILARIPAGERAKVVELFRSVGDSGTSVSQLMKYLFENFEGQDWSYELVIAIHDAGVRQPRLPMLRNSLLTTAVSAFEVIVKHLT